MRRSRLLPELPCTSLSPRMCGDRRAGASIRSWLFFCFCREHTGGALPIGKSLSRRRKRLPLPGIHSSHPYPIHRTDRCRNSDFGGRRRCLGVENENDLGSGCAFLAPVFSDGSWSRMQVWHRKKDLVIHGSLLFRNKFGPSIIASASILEEPAVALSAHFTRILEVG